MTRVLVFRDRQQIRSLSISPLRRITRHLLERELGSQNYELGIHFVDVALMTRMNEQFLHHEGSTDVITFDYGAHEAVWRELREGSVEIQFLSGEIFISVADAVEQAREFKTTWECEVVRYLIHGLLHLHGYDDSTPAPSRKMKREENRLVRLVTSQFAVAQLAGTRKPKRKARAFT